MTAAVPPGEFFQGVEQFNQQEFYACHDTLEALWLEALEPEKRFYQKIGFKASPFSEAEGDFLKIQYKDLIYGKIKNQ